MFELIGRIAVPGIDRTIKDIDSAAGSTENMAFHTGKAQRAVKTFGETLARTGDPLQALSNSAENLTHTFAKGLGATVAIAGAKLLIDKMKSLSEEVSKAAEISEKGLQKISEAGDFKTAIGSAKSLSEEMQKLRDRADALDSSFSWTGPLNIRLAGITDTMRNLADATKGAADAELMLQAQVEKNKAVKIQGYTDEQKAIYEISEARKKELESLKSITDESVRTKTEQFLKEKYAAEDARTAYLNGLKEQKQQSEDFAKSESEKAKQELKEYEAMSSGKLAAQKILFESESKEQESRSKALQDEIENQQKLAQLYQDRADQLEKLVDAQDQLNKKQNELATQGMGLGGTMRGSGAGGVGGTSSRGTGQRPTSYEIGAQRAQQQAAQKAQIQDAEKYRQQVQDDLVIQSLKKQNKYTGDISGLSKAQKNAIPGASPEAVQIEIKRQAVERARQQILENGTASLDKYKKSVETAQQAVNKTQNSIDNLSKSADNASASFDGKDYSLKPQTDNLTDSFLKGTEATNNMVDSFLKQTTETENLTDTITDTTDTLKEFDKQMKDINQAGPAGGASAASKKAIDPLLEILQAITKILDDLKLYSYAT
jgi:chromosome segregation ATPase